MAIYSAPNLSFIDTFVNAANIRDAKTQTLNDARLQGIKDLLNAGGEVYKNQLRKQAGDNEDAIAKYQWQIEKDPNTLINLRTTARNEAMNESIRQATEEATRSSELQNAWKQNIIDLDTANYELQNAELVYNQAKGKQDIAAMEQANVARNRAIANYNRLKNENLLLKNKVYSLLGIKDENNYNEELGFNDITGDLEQANIINRLDGELELLRKEITTDNVSITAKSKKENIENWKKKIEKAKQTINNSSLDINEKNIRTNLIADLEKALKNYSKKKSKGGQGTNIKVNYQNELDKLTTKEQLINKGYEWLRKAKENGATHKYLEAAVVIAAGR